MGTPRAAVLLVVLSQPRAKAHAHTHTCTHKFSPGNLCRARPRVLESWGEGAGREVPRSGDASAHPDKNILVLRSMRRMRRCCRGCEGFGACPARRQQQQEP